MVSALVNSSSRPAKAPLSTWSFAFGSAVALSGMPPRRRPLGRDGLGGLIDGGADAPDPVLPLRARGDDHGLLELVLLGIAVLAVDEAQLMMADGDHIAMLHGVLLDQLAVDVRAIGAVQVLEERVVQNVDDERMMAAHRRVIDADVVVRKAPNRVALLVHVVFREDLTIQAEHQACHRLILLAEPSQYFVKYTPLRGERLSDVRHDDRHVVPSAVIVRQLNQLFSNRIKISTKGADC